MHCRITDMHNKEVINISDGFASVALMMWR